MLPATLALALAGGGGGPSTPRRLILRLITGTGLVLGRAGRAHLEAELLFRPSDGGGRAGFGVPGDDVVVTMSRVVENVIAMSFDYYEKCTEQTILRSHNVAGHMRTYPSSSACWPRRRAEAAVAGARACTRNTTPVKQNSTRPAPFLPPSLLLSTRPAPSLPPSRHPRSAAGAPLTIIFRLCALQAV